jgi:putative ABC transport system permease protein
MGLTLRLAWRNLWRHPRRTWLTVGAMVFSNTILVFMISIQFGTYSMMINNTLRATTGHLQVQARGYQDQPRMRLVVPNIRALADDLRSALDSIAVAPRGMAFALASSEDRSFGIQVVGVEPEAEAQVSSLPGLVAEGRYLGVVDADEIVIGSVLARNLKVGVGDELTLLGSGRDGSVAAGLATVVGIVHSGVPDLDRSLAAMPLQTFQWTFAMEDAGHVIAIGAPDLLSVGGMETVIADRLPQGQNLTVLDWDDLHPGLKQAIQSDIASAWFMYGVLIVLVAFSVLNTQLMSVLERTREFGTVMALGLTPGRLGRLVVLETVLLGLFGLAAGLVVGGAVTVWFDVHGFTYPGLEEMAGSFNLPDRIHPELGFLSAIIGPGIVFLASVTASLYPAMRLRLLQPVAAMRSV